MKAMLLCAGYGRRLRPLTLKRPKVLVPVANIPVLLRNIKYIKRYGFDEIILNCHHLRDQLIDFLERLDIEGIRIEISIEENILGTGGGIKKAEWFFSDEPFLVINGDILTDIDLKDALKAHSHSDSLATMVIQRYPKFNQVGIDSNGYVCEISKEHKKGLYAFTGVHILDPKVLEYIPEAKFYSIIDCYRGILKRGGKIKAYTAEGHYWFDIGTIDSYIDANIFFLNEKKVLIGERCKISSDLTIDEWACIGDESTIEEDVTVLRSIIWERVHIKRGITLRDCIITDNNLIRHDLYGKIV